MTFCHIVFTIKLVHFFIDFCVKKEEFKCSNGLECISASQRCDNDNACSDGSDEIDCKCFVNELACFSGDCVDSRKLCDGNKDCKDGTDEKRCGE
jgi:hypothetical protein